MASDRSSPLEFENAVAARQFKRRLADVHDQDVEITGEVATVVLKTGFDPAQVVNTWHEKQEVRPHSHLMLPFKFAALIVEWAERSKLEI